MITSTADADIDATDTHLKTKRIITQAQKAIRAGRGASPIKIPSPVAVPFPPFPLSQGVNACPRIAASPATMAGFIPK